MARVSDGYGRVRMRRFDLSYTCTYSIGERSGLYGVKVTCGYCFGKDSPLRVAPYDTGCCLIEKISCVGGQTGGQTAQRHVAEQCTVKLSNCFQ